MAIIYGVRLLIVEDDPLMRSALSAGLTNLSIEVVATTDNAGAAIELAQKFQPDVVLLDLDLGDGPTGVDISVGLRHKIDNIGVVILSSYASPRLTGRYLQELPSGAIFLQKKNITDLNILAETINQAANYDPYNQNAAKISDLSEANNIRLTDLEIQLMRFIAQGLTNAEIAKRRFITERSAENAIRTLSKKIELDYDPDIHNQRIMISRKYFSMIGKL